VSDLWIDGRDEGDVAELCKTQPNLVGYNYVEDVTVMREDIATLEAQLAAERGRSLELASALEAICFHWDNCLNNLDSGAEYEAREHAREALQATAQEGE